MIHLIKKLFGRRQKEGNQTDFHPISSTTKEKPYLSTQQGTTLRSSAVSTTPPVAPNASFIPSKIKWEKINERDQELTASIHKYVVVDVETTGLDRSEDRIVEIGILQIESGQIIEKHSTIVNPGIHIKESASEINGIYDKDVANAPDYKAVSPIVAELLFDQVIIGHNIDFDRAFIGKMLDMIGAEGTIKYIDTLAYTKSILKTFPAEQRPENYKLQTLAKYFNISVENAHRALADTITTYKVFEKCKEIAQQQAEQKKLERKEQRKREKEAWNAKFEKSPLLNKNIVLTGEFTLERTQMESLACSVGAIPRDQVNGNTDYLVVGRIDNLPEWAYERKKGKADALAAQGKKVKQISESEYLSLIGNAKSVLSL